MAARVVVAMEVQVVPTAVAGAALVVEARAMLTGGARAAYGVEVRAMPTAVVAAVAEGGMAKGRIVGLVAEEVEKACKLHMTTCSTDEPLVCVVLRSRQRSSRYL